MSETNWQVIKCAVHMRPGLRIQIDAQRATCTRGNRDGDIRAAWQSRPRRESKERHHNLRGVNEC